MRISDWSSDVCSSDLIALGEQPAIMGAGEVTTLARHVWDRGEYCACGARVRDCPQWNAIVTRWTQGEPDGFLARYRRAQERTEALLAPARLLRLPGWRDHVRRTDRKSTRLNSSH